MSEPISVGKSDVEEDLGPPAWPGWPPRTPLDYLAIAIESVAITAFIGVILLTLFQVVARYVLYLPISWTEEAARLLFISSIMVGIALATRYHENIVVDFMFARWSNRGKAAAALTFNLAILGLLAIWLRGSLALMSVNAESTFVTVTWLRVSHVYALEAFCIVLTAIFILADMRRQLAVLRSGA